MSKVERYFSIIEAAELLRVSKWTVCKWLSSGQLKRTKAGSRTLVAESDLARFLTDCNSAVEVSQ